MTDSEPTTFWQRARVAAKSPAEARQFVLEYIALRAWMLLIGCFPIGVNLFTARLLGRIWWLAMKRHRARALDNLRPAFPGANERWLRQVARTSFEHFAQVYLVEMIQTPRLLNEASWPRYVEMHALGDAIRALLDEERGVILITPHFGNFELMGFTLARVGLAMTAVMRPLDNPLVNDYLVRLRAADGLSLLYKRGAINQAHEVLERRATLSFIADQDAGRKGIFADFVHRPASWYKSIGLLAMRYRVPIVVGIAARQGRGGFRYRFEVTEIIDVAAWSAAEQPLQWITNRFAAALERAIRKYPEQYLWVHRRWKTQPGDAAKRRATKSGDQSRDRSPPTVV